MKKLMKEESGFTFIELIAVLMIMAILAAVATPKVFEYVETARKNTVVSSARNVINGIQMICLTTGDVTAITKEDVKKYFANVGEVNVKYDAAKKQLVLPDNSAEDILNQEITVHLEEGQFALSKIDENCSFTYYQKLNGKIYFVKCTNAAVDTKSVGKLE